LASLQKTKERVLIMTVTRDFKETIQAKALKDPEFRKGLLTESIESMLEGDIETGKSLMRDYINATLGFEKLASIINKPTKSLMRMLSSKGNPTAQNLFIMVHTLKQQENVTFQVSTL